MDIKTKTPRQQIAAYIKWLQAENARLNKQVEALQKELARLRVKYGTQEE